MPREAKDVIGTVIEQVGGYTFKVIGEAERGWSRDRNNGYETPKQTIRKFDIECQGCGHVKIAAYSSVFGKKNCMCSKCKHANKPQPKTTAIGNRGLQKIAEEDVERKIKANGDIDKRSNKKNKVDYVGVTFECAFDNFLVIGEAERVLSRNGKHIYRNFHVRCLKCGTERETLIASLIAKGVACNNCRTSDRNVRLDKTLELPTLERKIQIIHEINEIWMDMKRMAKIGQLNRYLCDKFDAADYLKDIEDEETQHIERDNTTDNLDDIDYGDDSIDWNDELNKYL
jgi:hypothetical protein